MSPQRPKVFVVARNPDPDSSLPYLLRLPMASGELVLKAREVWPRTAKVFCHRAEGWPTDAEVLDEVAVRSCVRRGVAIDLVLDRGRENRSQFVFTRLGGDREGIFWQSARTTRKARPTYRLPTGRPAGLDGDLHILIDTREHYPYRFARQQATTERRGLPAGDYGVILDDEVVAVVERKTVADLTGRLSDGQLAFLLAELSCLPRSALVVEDRYADLLSNPHVRPGFLADQLAAITVRYPEVAIAFCDTRPLAEEWTYRFLAAALTYLRAERGGDQGPRA
ncbi:MAG TPA: ERCC4 domain-containing protein [Acidimicrobiales bacterium]|nr:ERCC4 domain-containing protein [Acidimicrobiales bacterium]